MHLKSQYITSVFFFLFYEFTYFAHLEHFLNASLLHIRNVATLENYDFYVYIFFQIYIGEPYIWYFMINTIIYFFWTSIYAHWFWIYGVSITEDTTCIRKIVFGLIIFNIGFRMNIERMHIKAYLAEFLRSS